MMMVKKNKEGVNTKYILSLFLIFVLLHCELFAAKSKITFSATSMQGSIKEGKNSTSLTGNAVVTVDTMEIKAERIEIYGKDYRYVKAIGAVKGEDKEKGFNFTSDNMQYDREKELATFFGSTELNDTKNDVKITSEYIEYNQKAETMLMQFDVKILRREINCTSMFAMYNRKSSALNLTGRPVVTKSKDTFKATKISVNLDTEDISLEGKVSGNVVDEKKKEESKKATSPTDKKKTKSENDEKIETDFSPVLPPKESSKQRDAKQEQTENTKETADKDSKEDKKVENNKTDGKGKQEVDGKKEEKEK